MAPDALAKPADAIPAKSKSDLEDPVEVAHVEETRISEGNSDLIEETGTSRVTWLVSATVSLGGFLFGTLVSPVCANRVENHSAH